MNIFIILESHQRSGLGKRLFQHMLAQENADPRLVITLMSCFTFIHAIFDQVLQFYFKSPFKGIPQEIKRPNC